MKVSSQTIIQAQSADGRTWYLGVPKYEGDSARDFKLRMKVAWEAMARGLAEANGGDS